MDIYTGSPMYLSNIHWYYIFDVNREAIARAAERDLGVFIISPTDKGGHLHTPSPEMKRLCSPLSPICFNNSYCLLQEGVSTIGVGASLPGHFTEHLKALSLLDSENKKIISDIDRKLRRVMFERTGLERPDALWHKLPHWEQAPGAINLRMVLWLHQLLQGWGLESFARERYAALNKGSAWVPGNNGAQAACLDFSDLQEVVDLAPDQLKQLVLRAHDCLKKE